MISRLQTTKAIVVRKVASSFQLNKPRHIETITFTHYVSKARRLILLSYWSDSVLDVFPNLAIGPSLPRF